MSRDENGDKGVFGKLRERFDLAGAAGMGAIGALLNGSATAEEAAVHAAHDLFIQDVARQAAEAEEDRRRGGATRR